ncbi:MAG: hypothetical protein U5N85_13935 [Arcicella sp.]|nr:hypothetical protein [Arcicella sp.]
MLLVILKVATENARSQNYALGGTRREKSLHGEKNAKNLHEEDTIIILQAKNQRSN